MPSQLGIEREEEFALMGRRRREEIENISTYNSFRRKIADIVKAEVPEHPHLPPRDEMVRMVTQSFKKPVAMWNEANAPVQGKRFKDYVKIAEKMLDMIEN